MAKTDSVACTKCPATFEQKKKSTFLGFRSFTCPKCESRLIYPLAASTRRVYWLLVVLFAAGFAVAFMKGAVAFPSPLLLLVLAALGRDWTIRQKLGELGIDAAGRREREPRSGWDSAASFDDAGEPESLVGRAAPAPATRRTAATR